MFKVAQNKTQTVSQIECFESGYLHFLGLSTDHKIIHILILKLEQS